MQITQINETEVTCPPNVGNRSFRPSYLGPDPAPNTPLLAPQINPTPSIMRSAKETRIHDWNNWPVENITSVTLSWSQLWIPPLSKQCILSTLFLSYLQAVLIRILQVMDVDVDMDDQNRQFKNVIDNFFFFFSGQTVCSVRIEINVLQGNSEITSNLEL